MTGTTDAAPAGRTRSTVSRSLVRGGAALGAALVLLQAALAGQMLAGASSLLAVHEVGSHTLNGVTWVVAVVAVVGWRRRQLAGRVAALAGITVVLVAAQSWVGYSRTLALHVPLGVTLLGVFLVLLAVATRRP